MPLTNDEVEVEIRALDSGGTASAPDLTSIELVRFPISISTPYHELHEQLLDAQIAALTTAFSAASVKPKICVVVADTLRMHTVKSGTPEYAREKYNQAGNTWLEKYKSHFDLLSKFGFTIEFQKWDEALKDAKQTLGEELKPFNVTAASSSRKDQVVTEAAVFYLNNQGNTSPKQSLIDSGCELVHEERFVIKAWEVEARVRSIKTAMLYPFTFPKLDKDTGELDFRDSHNRVSTFQSITNSAKEKAAEHINTKGIANSGPGMVILDAKFMPDDVLQAILNNSSSTKKKQPAKNRSSSPARNQHPNTGRLSQRMFPAPQEALTNRHGTAYIHSEDSRSLPSSSHTPISSSIIGLRSNSWPPASHSLSFYTPKVDPTTVFNLFRAGFVTALETQSPEQRDTVKQLMVDTLQILDDRAGIIENHIHINEGKRM